MRISPHAERADRLRVVLSLVLAIGVLTSAVLVGIGFLGALVFGWDHSLAGVAGGSGSLTDMTRVGVRLVQLRPVGLVQLGLLVLLATPVLRVATATIAFAVERDATYALISGAVLTILLVSIFLVR
jgi:uncharacterized membrane protein